MDVDPSHVRTSGFRGKRCIHPRQVGAVRTAFAHSADEVDDAMTLRLRRHDAVGDVVWCRGKVAGTRQNQGGELSAMGMVEVGLPTA